MSERDELMEKVEVAAEEAGLDVVSMPPADFEETDYPVAYDEPTSNGHPMVALAIGVAAGAGASYLIGKLPKAIRWVKGKVGGKKKKAEVVAEPVSEEEISENTDEETEMKSN